MQDVESRAMEMDGRRGCRVVASVELRPGAWRVLLLDALDAPGLVTVSDREIGHGEVDAIVEIALRSRHADVVEFMERVADAEWGHICVQNALDMMASTGPLAPCDQR